MACGTLTVALGAQSEMELLVVPGKHNDMSGRKGKDCTTTMQKI